MNRFIALAGMTAASLALAGCVENQGAAAPEARTVTVEGSGRSAATPTRATLVLAVTSKAATARDALSTNSTSMTTVIAALKALGIGQTEMQTSGLSLQPQYEYADGQQKLTGYQAENSITLTVKDLARLGEIIDLAVSSGANEIRGLSFDVTDKTAALNEARQRAVTDARARADLYAAGLGARLGEPLRISESQSATAPVPVQTMRAEAANVPVALGEMALEATVTVTFALQ